MMWLSRDSGDYVVMNTVAILNGECETNMRRVGDYDVLHGEILRTSSRIPDTLATLCLNMI